MGCLLLKRLIKYILKEGNWTQKGKVAAVRTEMGKTWINKNKHLQLIKQLKQLNFGKKWLK